MTPALMRYQLSAEVSALSCELKSMENLVAGPSTGSSVSCPLKAELLLTSGVTKAWPFDRLCGLALRLKAESNSTAWEMEAGGSGI